MPEPPKLTDRRALARNRARAAKAKTPALFLQHEAADEVKERLAGVNRTFTSPAIVSGNPTFWRNVMSGAKMAADTPTLDLEPAAHDLVVHAMALHWADDPVGQLVQCRRALRADGLLVAIFLGGQTLAELRASLGQAEARVMGGMSPRVAPMGEIRDLGGLLQRAGFALPVADSFSLTGSYRDLFHLMHDLRDMGENNALQARLRKPARRALFDTANQVYTENFALPDGRLPATYEFLVLTGWAPDATQPQPLRPGSAAQRLADALDTFEIPINEGRDKPRR